MNTIAIVDKTSTNTKKSTTNTTSKNPEKSTKHNTTKEELKRDREEMRQPGIRMNEELFKERNPRGGDFHDCLSATEIDSVLAPIKQVLSAFLFYKFRLGKISQEEFYSKIKEGLEAHGIIYMPLHIRYHWILMIVRQAEGGVCGEIFDSAPSKLVIKEVKKILRDTVPNLTFRPTMRQHRGSNECGIFVIANTFRHVKGLPICYPEIPFSASLKHIRQALVANKKEEAVCWMEAEDYPRLSGGDWWGDISNLEIDTKLQSLGLAAVPGIFSTDMDGMIHQVRAAKRRNKVVVIPLWFPNHWILGMCKGEDVWFMDSAPGRGRPTMIEAAKRLISKGRAWVVDSPLQPAGSNQCGIHVMVNAILFYFGIILSAEQFPTLDLDLFRHQEWRIVDLFESLFTLTEKKVSECDTGSEVVYTREGNWFKGIITSKRRGMTMVRGVSVTIPSVMVEHVWQGEETFMTYCLREHKVSALNPLQPSARPQIPDCPAPTSAPEDPANGTTPAIAQNLTLDPQYQHITTPAPVEGEENLRYEEGTINLLSDEVVRFLTNAPINAGYHFSAEGAFKPPHLYKMKDIKTFRIAEQRELPHLAKTALANSTTTQHRQSLAMIQQADADLDELSLDLALIEFFSRCAVRRGWKPSTLETRLSMTAGALRLLPLYATGASPIVMGQSCLWSQAVRAAHKRRLHQFTKRATPATWAQVEEIMRNFEGDAAWLIMLAYCACARVGDACRLRRQDINMEEGGLVVTFRKGKTTMKRGAYTVPASLPRNSPLSQNLLTFLRSKRGFLFKKQAYKETIVLLRTVQLTQHSLRRGAIQQLAASGMPATEMLKFTGHNTVASLISYLDDGQLDPAIQVGLIQGQVLFGAGTDLGGCPHPPTTNEILQAFPTLDRRTVTFHAKKVGHLNLEAVLKLEVEDTRTTQYVKEAAEWLTEPRCYESLLEQGEVLKEDRISPLSNALMHRLLDAKCEVEKEGETARAEVFPFGVTELKAPPPPEQMYWRLRPITEPRINKRIEVIPRIKLTSLEDNIEGARQGKRGCVIQLDAVAWYDQIPLGQFVRVFFAISWKGRYYYLKSLPMGLRLAVWIACAITWHLVNFKHAGVWVNTFVDNFRFAGEVDATVKAVLEFVRRCKSVGATLDHMPDTEEEALALNEKVGSFLGAKFNYAEERMSLTDKTCAKLGLIDIGAMAKNSISFRQFSVLMGLYNFAGRVLKYPFYRAFHLLRRYREEATAEALFPDKVWGARELFLSPTEFKELKEMQEFLANNKEVCYKRDPEVDAVIFSDACSSGWGGLIICNAVKKVVAGTWNPEEVKKGMYESSATSEPLGLIKVWEAVKDLQFQHAIVYLDHSPLVWGFARSRPFSFHYNCALEALSRNGKSVTVRFVPGVLNPADYPSRGSEIPTKWRRYQNF